LRDPVTHGDRRATDIDLQGKEMLTYRVVHGELVPEVRPSGDAASGRWGALHRIRPVSTGTPDARVPTGLPEDDTRAGRAEKIRRAIASEVSDIADAADATHIGQIMTSVGKQHPPAPRTDQGNVSEGNAIAAMVAVAFLAEAASRWVVEHLRREGRHDGGDT
jgi:hypothetical protein